MEKYSVLRLCIADSPGLENGTENSWYNLTSMCDFSESIKCVTCAYSSIVNGLLKCVVGELVNPTTQTKGTGLNTMTKSSKMSTSMLHIC
jgi:hypothetical protein